MFDQEQDTFDPSKDELPLVEQAPRIAVIRTSDRLSFKQCRRAWGWSSHLRGNLGGRVIISAFWLGTGFHFAMEDFHGKNLYGHPSRAIRAYAHATRRRDRNSLPSGWKEDLQLGESMLTYYADEWLQYRDPYETFYFNGEPQVEVNFRIIIPFDEELLHEWGYDQAIYSGTLDRVAIDDLGRLWILEYKTAKSIVTHGFLHTDQQVSAYCWAASVLYPSFPIGGVIYQQHRKLVADQPRYLAGGKLSTDKKQTCTYHAYRRAATNLYGDINRAPADVIGCLNHLAELETPEYNNFIRRDRVYRNEHQIQAEGEKILLEAADMLNPDLPLYPSPTRNCTWCAFNGPCVSIDDGSDWEHELQVLYRPREQGYDSWRKYLPSPEDLEAA